MSWYLGLRPKCCYAAKISYLDLETRWLYIPSTNNKQRLQRRAKIPRILVPRLKNYLELRNFMFPDSQWLFPSAWKRDNYFGGDTYWEFFRNTCKKAGIYMVNFIDKAGHKRSAYTSYGLRKGGATRVWNDTGDLIKVKEYLGHTDPRLRSTWRYVENDSEKVREEVSDEVFDKIKIKSQDSKEIMAYLNKIFYSVQNNGAGVFARQHPLSNI